MRCERHAAPPQPRLTRGYDAAVYGALLAGCRSFHGGTTGLAGDLSDTAARLFPACGGVFLGAASEGAAFDAVRAEAATGDRTMAAVSGAALWQLLAEAERAQLPLVALHVRAEALPSEVVPAGGEPAFVLAPASPQELADLTCLAFDLAHRHRRPAVVLVDPFLGQMVEPVSLPCVTCDRQHRAPCGVSTGELISIGDPTDRREARWEEGGTQDADVLLVSWGSAARTLPRAMGLARAQGLRAGFLRPVSLAPFPSARLAALSDTVRSLVLLEASPSPWSDAVRTAAGGRVPVTVVRGGAGTGLPSAEETARALLQRA
jgi:pyruvate/2-oxoacid:ferredoxin oxidoreductase alpha subunit